MGLREWKQFLAGGGAQAAALSRGFYILFEKSTAQHINIIYYHLCSSLFCSETGGRPLVLKGILLGVVEVS